jgi:hypothetical protein
MTRLQLRFEPAACSSMSTRTSQDRSVTRSQPYPHPEQPGADVPPLLQPAMRAAYARTRQLSIKVFSEMLFPRVNFTSRPLLFSSQNAARLTLELAAYPSDRLLIPINVREYPLFSNQSVPCGRRAWSVRHATKPGMRTAAHAISPPFSKRALLRASICLHTVRVTKRQNPPGAFTRIQSDWWSNRWSETTLMVSACRYHK